MKFPSFSADGSPRGDVAFEGVPTFEGDKGVQALKEVVVAQAANARLGTHSTLTRGEVRGGGKKPWRQKGTGRARHGSIRSPIWTGGGVVFGPKPRDYTKKINSKVKALAFRRAFFDRCQDNSIIVIESLALPSGKTRDAAALVRRLALAPKASVLFVDTAFTESAARATSNVSLIARTEAASLNATDLCRYDKIVFTESAIQAILGRLGGAA